MLIEVFGPGCPKCQRSAETARGFLTDRHLEGEVREYHDLDAMIERGVLRTPTVFVDSEKVIEGRVLRPQDLERWLASHGG